MKKFNSDDVYLTFNGQKIEGFKIEEMSEASEVEKIVDRIEFRNPPFPMKLVCRRRLAGIEIMLKICVPDRDTGESTIIHHPIYVAHDVLTYIKNDDLVHLILSRVKNAMVHEMCEVFHFDGVRVADPHKRDKF